MKGVGLAVMVTNPCPPCPALSQSCPCFWGCWPPVLKPWGQVAPLCCPRPPRVRASSRSARWVSPRVPRTRRGLSLDLDTTSRTSMELIMCTTFTDFNFHIHFSSIFSWFIYFIMIIINNKCSYRLLSLYTWTWMVFKADLIYSGHMFELFLSPSFTHKCIYLLYYNSMVKYIEII